MNDSVPSVLYHGTSSRFLEAVLSGGLRPRGDSPSQWEDKPSRGDMVYLTDNYAHYYAHNACKDEPWLIVEVATEDICSEFVPDEDFIFSCLKSKLSDGPQDELHQTVRDDLLRWQPLWPVSLKALGTVAHRGIIPPAAITRYCHFDYRRRSSEFCELVDTAISPQAYGSSGAMNRQILSWLFGDSPELPTDSCSSPLAIEYYRNASRDRTGVQVVSCRDELHVSSPMPK